MLGEEKGQAQCYWRSDLFHRNPKNVSKIGDICIKEFHENRGIGTVNKTYPWPWFSKS